MTVDFGLGPIPLGDFVIAIVAIIAAVGVYWYLKSRSD